MSAVSTMPVAAPPVAGFETKYSREWAREQLRSGRGIRTNQMELAADGWSVPAIARETDVSEQRVVEILDGDIPSLRGAR